MPYVTITIELEGCHPNRKAMLGFLWLAGFRTESYSATRQRTIIAVQGILGPGSATAWERIYQDMDERSNGAIRSITCTDGPQRWAVQPNGVLLLIEPITLGGIPL